MYSFYISTGNIESESCSDVSDSLWPHRRYNPWNSPGQNTGVSSLSLFQGVFPTQGSNPGLPHCRWILYQLSHKGSPRILEWVAYPFSRGSSWPRNQTGVSCITGGFSTNWAIREALDKEQVSFYIMKFHHYMVFIYDEPLRAAGASVFDQNRCSVNWVNE